MLCLWRSFSKFGIATITVLIFNLIASFLILGSGVLFFSRALPQIYMQWHWFPILMFSLATLSFIFTLALLVSSCTSPFPSLLPDKPRPSLPARARLPFTLLHKYLFLVVGALCTISPSSIIASTVGLDASLSIFFDIPLDSVTDAAEVCRLLLGEVARMFVGHSAHHIP